MATSTNASSPVNFYNEFQPRFIASFMKKFPAVRREEIEDLYQETYIIVYNQYSAGKTKEDTNWWAYIHTVGFNQMAKKMRIKMPAMVSIDDNGDGEGVSPYMIEMEATVNESAAGEESAEEKEEKYLKLESALDSMSEKVAAIVSDKYIHKLSDKEIAEKWGYANASTVKAKRFQVVKKIKEVCGAGAA